MFHTGTKKARLREYLHLTFDNLAYPLYWDVKHHLVQYV